jgi:hypothetical protein
MKLRIHSKSTILNLLYFPVKGVFSLPIQVEPGMAPEAQLLIYAILPNEELVADAQNFEIEKCFANKVGVCV